MTKHSFKNKSNTALQKKAKKGFQGFPVATIAFYGPTNKKATKLVVSILATDGADPDPMRKWYSDDDLRSAPDVLNEVLDMIKDNQVKSVAMYDKIIGCPHQEGIDYPEGETCPLCPFWKNRDRWSGEYIH